MKYLFIFLTLINLSAQVIFPTNTLGTNHSPVSFTNCFPYLNFDANRRIAPIFASVHPEYRLNLWQWEFKADNNSIHIYDSSNNYVASSEENNGTMNISMLDAWVIQSDASGQIVAIIDSGVDCTLSEFSNIYSNTPNSWKSDYQGHGTLVASVCLASNCNGMVGVARGAILLPIKSSLNDFEVSTQIIWAVSQGAKVFNLSFGYSQGYPTNTIAAIRAATNAIFVEAALNGHAFNGGILNADNPIVARDWIPQSHLSNVICVTACNKAGELFDAVIGTNVLLAAPSRRIFSLGASNLVANLYSPKRFKDEAVGEFRTYYSATGTSLGSPEVAGAVAILQKRYPNESPIQIIERIEKSVDKTPYWADKVKSGGTLNVYRSLIYSRAVNLTIGINGVFAAGPENSLAQIDISEDLVNWGYYSTVTNDGFPHLIAPVSNGNNLFFRIREVQ